MNERIGKIVGKKARVPSIYQTLVAVAQLIYSKNESDILSIEFSVLVLSSSRFYLTKANRNEAYFASELASAPLLYLVSGSAGTFSNYMQLHPFHGGHEHAFMNCFFSLSINSL